ncbi:DUF2157 domain-containing protein, partial [Thermaurantiacus sp.]
MSLERDLARWVSAGLIDQASADRILTHEAKAARPIWLWALVALGSVSVGLGLLLLVAANWDTIPKPAKLAGHLLLTAAAAGAVALARQKPWLSEGALFLLLCLVLGGLALQAQIYQLSGPSWGLLLTALLLSGPALLLHGRTWLAGVAFALLTLATATLLLPELADRGPLGQRPDFPLQSLLLAAPLLLLALGLAAGGVPHPGMARPLRALPLLVLAAAAYLVGRSIWRMEVTPADVPPALRLLLVPLPVAALALWLNGRSGRLPPRLLEALLIGPLLTLILPFLIPHPEDMVWARLLGILITLLALGWVGF